MTALEKRHSHSSFKFESKLKRLKELKEHGRDRKKNIQSTIKKASEKMDTFHLYWYNSAYVQGPFRHGLKKLRSLHHVKQQED
jgi:hypothetical protein